MTTKKSISNLSKKDMLAMLKAQEKKLALSVAKNVKLQSEVEVLANSKTDLDKESKYFLKKDKSVYIVRNLTTSLKFFETQTKIMTEIMKLNSNQLMSLNQFHKHLAIYLRDNLK